MKTILHSGFSSLTSLLVAGSLVFALPTAYAETPTIKDLAAVQRPLADLSPSEDTAEDLKITAWVDRSDNTYAYGENVTFSVKTNRDAYLIIVDVGTSGEVTMIYPNQFSTNNRVRANEIIQVPDPRASFNFQVQRPAGTELIKVIATREPLPPFDTDETKAARPFKSLKAPADIVAKDLAVMLHKPRPIQWAMYNKVIRVVPSR